MYYLLNCHGENIIINKHNLAIFIYNTTLFFLLPMSTNSSKNNQTCIPPSDTSVIPVGTLTSKCITTIQTVTTTVIKPAPTTIQIDYINSSVHFKVGKTNVDACYQGRQLSEKANKQWIDEIFQNAQAARVKNNGTRCIAFDSDYVSKMKRLDPFYTNCAFVYDKRVEDPIHWTLFAYALASPEMMVVNPTVQETKQSTPMDTITSDIEKMNITIVPSKTDVVVKQKSTFANEYMCACEEHHGVRKCFWFYNWQAERFICLSKGCAKKFGMDLSVLAVFERCFRYCVHCKTVHMARDMDSGLCLSCRGILNRPAQPLGHRACTACQRMCQRGQCKVCMSVEKAKFGIKYKSFQKVFNRSSWDN